MMSEVERTLLSNALDALDRLHDGDSTVADVYDLFYATAAALRDTDYHTPFAAVLPALAEVVRFVEGRETRRSKALWVTDDLRQYLARSLPFDQCDI